MTATTPKMSYPAVSVIICTYNRDQSVCSAISSVLSQDYPGGVQLIVVDQSESHSHEVATFLCAHASRLCYLRLTTPNLPAARNAGFSQALGDLALFVDDDIVLRSCAVSKLAKHFRRFRLQAISGLVISERDPEASLERYAREYGRQGLDSYAAPVEVSRFIGALICAPAEIVRRLDGFDENFGRLTPAAYGEDDDFCYRLRRADVRLFIDPSVRVTHREHLAGGCASRWTDPAVARRYHMRSIAYMSAKYEGRVGIRGWTRLTRGFVLNRETLSGGFRCVHNRFQDACKAVAEVETFISTNKNPACSVKALQ